MSDPVAPPQEFRSILERLEKVVYIEPPGGRPMDGIQVLLNDARWLAKHLKIALEEINRLTPKEAA
jgi:hypothetical protein